MTSRLTLALARFPLIFSFPNAWHVLLRRSIGTCEYKSSHRLDTFSGVDSIFRQQFWTVKAHAIARSQLRRPRGSSRSMCVIKIALRSLPLNNCQTVYGENLRDD